MTEEKQQPVSLASLLTPSKTVTVDYPTLAGFTVDLCYLAREELLKLRKKESSITKVLILKVFINFLDHSLLKKNFS